VNDERSATLSDKAERPEKKRQSAPGFAVKRSCNQILARFLLVKSATKGPNVLYNPFRERTPNHRGSYDRILDDGILPLILAVLRGRSSIRIK
jgi:hypothetical protein